MDHSLPFTHLPAHPPQSPIFSAATSPILRKSPPNCSGLDYVLRVRDTRWRGSEELYPHKTVREQVKPKTLTQNSILGRVLREMLLGLDAMSQEVAPRPSHFCPISEAGLLTGARLPTGMLGSPLPLRVLLSERQSEVHAAHKVQPGARRSSQGFCCLF